jgi:hypothetical protein
MDNLRQSSENDYFMFMQGGGSGSYPSYPTGHAAPPAYSPYPGNAPLFNPVRIKFNKLR